MPKSPSDDPAEAGFVRQWVKHALVFIDDSSRQLVLAIMSKRRLPDDQWAQGVESQLRETIRTAVEKNAKSPIVSRIFCNSVGCLCYVEEEGHSPDTISMFQMLDSEAGQHFGIGKSDARLVATSSGYKDPGTDHSTSWYLLVVSRPAGR